MSRFSILFAQFSQQDVKSITYCSGGSLTTAKFILTNLFYNKKGMLSHDESHIIVKKIKNITDNIIPLFSYSFFRFLPFQIAHVLLFLAHLLVVFCRTFLCHMSLEARRCGAIKVAVFTGKGLLTSVRSNVLF